MPCAVHCPQLPQHDVQHVPEQDVDRPGRLDGLDELGRRDQPELGMHPAHQGLDADQFALGQVDLGLVVHDDPALFDGLPELGDQLEPAAVDLAHARAGRSAAVSDLRLGGQHRHLGPLQQRARVEALSPPTSTVPPGTKAMPTTACGSTSMPSSE